ncbi:hypothetical protein ACFSWE_13575 [Leucobacter albus]|uniref:Sortase family protein n=1 Tax=Leucobacter albus TaxID=272210 RepID=A0ABW3TNW2_9MICO
MNEEANPAGRRRSRLPRWVGWIGAGAAVVLVGAGVWAVLVSGLFGGEPHEPAAPNERPASTDAPSREPQPAESAAASKPSQLDIASTLYMPYSPVWDPPDEGENFWQVVDDDNGYPEFGGTTYLLAHACYDGQCVGDDARALVPGDSLTFRGARYLVDEKLEIDKAAIGDQNIWEHRDGQLVVITCIIDPSTGAIAENAILVASLQN